MTLSSRSSRYHRAREDFFTRGGLAFGLPLGAAGYEAGGWWLVLVGFALTLVITVALACYELWRDATDEIRRQQRASD